MLQTLVELLNWMWQKGAEALYGPLVIYLASVLWKKARAVAAKKPSSFRQWARGSEKRNLLWLRRYRFDTAWIGREVSRGHTCQILFLLWFGLWVIAMGLRETFNVTGTPLAKSPGSAILSALPMYAFEICWIYYSGRAAKLIKHRQKIKAWRYHK